MAAAFKPTVCCYSTQYSTFRRYVLPPSSYGWYCYLLQYSHPERFASLMIYVGGQVNINQRVWQPEDGNNGIFRNAAIHLRDYLVSHCRWQRSGYGWFQCCVVVFISPVFSASYPIPFILYSPAFPLCCSPASSFPPPKWGFFL